MASCPDAGTVTALTEALVSFYAGLWNQILACSCAGTPWGMSLFVSPSFWQRFRNRAMKTERLMLASVANVPDCCGTPKWLPHGLLSLALCYSFRYYTGLMPTKIQPQTSFLTIPA